MQARERIAKLVVEKYKDTICLMVEIHQCLMEAVEPRIVWIMPMGYEVDSQILEDVCCKPIDTSKERFGNFTEKDLELHTQLKRPQIIR